MTVRRRGHLGQLKLTAERGCGGRFVLTPSHKLNAWSNGKYVAITTAILGAAGNDDELAFVVAHEMAHNILNHANRRGRRSPNSGDKRIAPLGKVDMEFAADQLALKIMHDAGFDFKAATSFLRHVKPDVPQLFSFTHPGLKARVARIERSAIKVMVEHRRVETTAARRGTGAPECNC